MNYNTVEIKNRTTYELLFDSGGSMKLEKFGQERGVPPLDLLSYTCWPQIYISTTDV